MEYAPNLVSAGQLLRAVRDAGLGTGAAYRYV
jgi:hypothetical protein